MRKILNLKLIMLGFQNKRIFLLTDTPQIGQKKFLLVKKKSKVTWTYVVNDLNGDSITGSFYEKELQKTSQGKFRVEKVLKRKDDKLYVKWKGHDNSFNS